MTGSGAVEVTGAVEDVAQPMSVPRQSRQHVDENEYHTWVKLHISQPPARYERMGAYRRFVERWPDLEDWFTAPLQVRLGFVGEGMRSNGRTDSHRASGYLVYLSMVKGIGLDFDYLLGRKYARLLDRRGGGAGLGVDLALFEQWAARLTQLGHSHAKARDALMWCLGRLMLYRGDPDLTAITAEDLFSFGSAIRAFGARDDFNTLRRILFSNGQFRDDGDANTRFLQNQLAKLHGTHVLLFNVGQVAAEPRNGTRKIENWTDHFLPEPCPPKIRAVVERYLRLRLDAKIDRPQTVHLARQALRRFVNWLASDQPHITSLAQVDRATIERYMQWLPTCPSQHTGLPLATTSVKHELNGIAAFFRDTAVWGWAETPGRPLLTSRDTPRRPESIPRYLPQHDLDSIMSAVDDLTDPLQRAALLLLRWSGARRGEIRRLTLDCLDAYPGGHPRLRIPVGKGNSERIIPLHPDAAAALEHVIALAKAQQPIARIDEQTGRRVDYVFVRRGKLVSAKTLFDEAFRTACSAASLVDDRGMPTVSAHRFRHTLGTQLAEGGARIQTIMAVLGHKSATMSMIYSRISDPEIRKQYEAALAGGRRIAGPAAEALMHDALDAKTVDWLQSNFLKTELELGHCLRLPAEGPCECELMLTCPKFLTTTEYEPRIRARLDTEHKLIADAKARGWDREVERHTATCRRLQHLLDELDCP